MKNIAIAVALLRLEPVYRELEFFRSIAFFKGIGKLLTGKADGPAQRTLLLSIAEVYTRLYEMRDTFEETTVSALPQLPIDVDPKQVVSEIRRLGKVMDSNLFQNLASIMDEL